MQIRSLSYEKNGFVSNENLLEMLEEKNPVDLIKAKIASSTNPDELKFSLKKEADDLGIAYHPKIGIDKLEGKIAQTKKVVEATPVTRVMTEAEKISRRNTKMRNEAGKLIRIRLSCLNPNKKNWPGEIISVSNRVIGVFKKYIPFNAEVGYHVPNIIYQHLVERQCQIFKKIPKPNGETKVVSKLIREFAIEVLPPLTQVELDKLATVQTAKQSVDQD
jgi:hypothetical protein